MADRRIPAASWFAREGASQRRLLFALFGIALAGLLWGAFALAKNLLGVAFILAGVAMLVLPGQGLLTILLGLGLTNFPGKYALEQRLVARPSVRWALDQIRQKAGRPPFRWVKPEDRASRGDRAFGRPRR